MNYSKLFLLILVICTIGVVGLSCKQDEGTVNKSVPENAESEYETQDPESALKQRIEDTKHLQVKRKEIIDGMLEAGLASRIENPNGAPFIYVTEPFYLLTVEEQASLMNVVWYYYITDDGSVDVLTIYDEESGKEIGTFGRKGLVMGE